MRARRKVAQDISRRATAWHNGEASPRASLGMQASAALNFHSKWTRRSSRWILATALVGFMPKVAWAMAFTQPAERSGSTRVAVSVMPLDDTQTFLLGELRFLGLDPIPLVVEGLPDFDTLERLAREGDYAAILHVDRQRAQVQVSVLDRMTGKMSARRLEAEQHLAPRDVAVRAVELLRASLLELTAVQPPEREVEVPAQLVPIRVRTPRWGLSLGGAVAGAPGGLSPLAALRLAFWGMIHPNVGLVVSGMAPLSSARVEGPEGEALVRIGWITGGARFALAPNHRWVRPSISVVAGPVFLGMEGQAVPPYRGGRARVVSGVVESELALDFVLSPQWRIRLAGAVGVCVTWPEVRFAGRRVARWCMPYGAGQAGVAIEW